MSFTESSSIDDEVDVAAHSTSSSSSSSSPIVQTGDIGFLEDEEIPVEVSSSSENESESSSSEESISQSNQICCRLCIELHKHGFPLSQFRNSTIQNDYLTESCLCRCANQTPIHTICLQRWIRLTADKPCTKCRHLFEAPSHLTRLVTFGDVVIYRYVFELIVSLWFVNMWLFKDLFWLIIGDFDRYEQYFGNQMETFTAIINNIRWSLLLEVIPFMNIFVLNYFYLTYRARLSDVGLIQFSYRLIRGHATQLYSSKMVAYHYIQRGIYKISSINYGQVYDACSWCGRSIVTDDDDDREYLRSICRCHGFHRDCLRYVTETDGSSTLSPYRCPNCGEHFDFVTMVIRFTRDLICLPYSRSRSIFNAIRQTKLPRRVPSYFEYLFNTKFGLRTLITFVSVICLYLMVELIMSKINLMKQINENGKEINWINYTQSYMFNDVCYQSMDEQRTIENVWNIVPNKTIKLQVIWFCCEFFRLSYRSYLNDFERHRQELKSHFVY
ncbi:hypothetical protein RDWZM_004233 [Blomia tropicalis]|uniref:RING-CH-type domain-containing protein n=1 Tax=Blomia tropicalis TaxID=40697 RepID=A0A9Q0MIC5_BLOTA|nr:hypothetical protein RDWZM_004233 [Blomia tropicalis]